MNLSLIIHIRLLEIVPAMILLSSPLLPRPWYFFFSPVYFLLAIFCFWCIFSLLYQWLSLLCHCQVPAPRQFPHICVISTRLKMCSADLLSFLLLCATLSSDPSAPWSLTVLASRSFQLHLLPQGGLTSSCGPIPCAANWKFKFEQLDGSPLSFTFSWITILRPDVWKILSHMWSFFKLFQMGG